MRNEILADMIRVIAQREEKSRASIIKDCGYTVQYVTECVSQCYAPKRLLDALYENGYLSQKEVKRYFAQMLGLKQKQYIEKLGLETKDFVKGLTYER